jgi:hypothetical protein
MTARPDQRADGSTRRLLVALAVTAVVLGPFAYVVYGAGLAQSAMTIAGAALMLALAIGVAWASHRGGPRAR